MKTFLDIITSDTAAHLHMDIEIIYSVIYISPFTNDDVLYIYKTFVYSVLPEDG